MKCLIVVPSLKRAGAETQAVDLANGLSSIGHSVHLCSFEPQLDQKGRLADAVRFHHVQRKTKYDPSLIVGITEIIDREHIEVVQGVLQFAVLVAWLASRRSARRPPVVAAVHTTTNRGLKEELHDRLLYRWILRRLPAVVFVCNYQRDYWVRKYPELGPLARVVHNGIDVRRFRRSDFVDPARKLRADLVIPETAFVFACIAAFRPEKGHRLLIEAFSQLPAGTFLMLAGDGGELPAIEAAVRTAGLSDRVRFLGNVPDIRPVVVASNSTVLPSTAVETFSMAMLESMALEVPMIASRIGGLEEAIVHGETGILLPIGDVTALATGMRQMIVSPALARMMGHAAALRVRSAFTLEKMIDGSESVLSGAIHLKAIDSFSP
jgi:glycosyltransferase involved in cell wall biosynthesis